ncbi:MAG TPA: cyclase family protein [Acidimicrobiales bacterium]|nr:cyclase family protein [Acidimicrobiales bacterium]
MAERLRAEDVIEIARRHRNWGRWGEQDQIGTVNFIDAEAVLRAASLVRQGKVISCALPYDDNGPQVGTFGRVNPIHLMLQDGGDAASGAQDNLDGIRYADDAVYMPLQCGTQWDALSHIFYDGTMYNGFPQELVNSRGTSVCGVENYADKIVTRGVFLDIPRYRGVDWLEPGEGIGADDLERCAERYGVGPVRGDIILVRTGAVAMARSNGTWGTYSGGDAPGLNLTAAEWLCEREVAGVATDTWGMEVRPNETDEIFQPLHVVLLVNAGMLVGEIFDFEKLSTDCAEDGVYEFMFVAPPLPFTGAVGSPLNPLAIK